MTDEEYAAVAEALHIVGTRPGFTEMDAWTRWTTLAAAAIAALPPSPAEEAVKRVEALHPRLEPRRGHFFCGGREHGTGFSQPWPCPTIAALASPAPAPQGEDGRP